MFVKSENKLAAMDATASTVAAFDLDCFMSWVNLLQTRELWQVPFFRLSALNTFYCECSHTFNCVKFSIKHFHRKISQSVHCFFRKWIWVLPCLFTHMACRVQSAAQQDRDPSLLPHHPLLYPTSGHMGSVVSDPVRGRQSRPSPRTSQANHLIVEKQSLVTQFHIVHCLCLLIFGLFLPHLSCRAQFEASPGHPSPPPPQWTHWSSPVQTCFYSSYKPLGWWSLWVTRRS